MLENKNGNRNYFISMCSGKYKKRKFFLKKMPNFCFTERREFKKLVKNPGTEKIFHLKPF